MKNIFKQFAFAALCIATVAFVSCKNDDPDPDPDTTTYTESASYAILYNDATVAAGQTIDYHPSDNEIEMEMACVNLLFENKTSGDLSSAIKIEKLEGPDAMNDIMICYGETCKNPTCPWTSDLFTMVPGINDELPIKFEYTPSNVTAKTTYRMTLGKGTSLDDPQVILITVNAQ